jgi:hypothetical protein
MTAAEESATRERLIAEARRRNVRSLLRLFRTIPAEQRKLTATMLRAGPLVAPIILLASPEFQREIGRAFKGEARREMLRRI